MTKRPSLFCGNSSDPPPKWTQGTVTNPHLIQVWSRARSAIRTSLWLHYCQIQQSATKYPFSWDEGDSTGEPRLFAGSSEASKASVGTEHIMGHSLFSNWSIVRCDTERKDTLISSPVADMWGGQTFFSLVIMYLSYPCSDKHWFFVLHQFLC